MRVQRNLHFLVAISFALIVPGCQSRDESGGGSTDTPPVEPQGTFQGKYISFDLRTRVEDAVQFVHPTTDTSKPQIVPGREGGIPIDEPIPFAFTELREVGVPTVPRFSPHGRIFTGVLHPNGTPDGGWCSATLIGPRLLLTAAHCVFTNLQGKLPQHVWAEYVVFAPATTDSLRPFGAAFGEVIFLFKEWRNELNHFHDIAIVSLDRPVGFLAGWRGVGIHPDCEYWEASGWTAIGYRAQRMLARTGSFDKCSALPAPAEFEFDFDPNDIEFGVSGGGLVKDFKQDGETHAIVWGTIFGAIAEIGDPTVRKSVTRLDLNKFYATDVAKEVSAPDEPDLAVLNLVMPKVNLWENEGIEGMNFVVGNVGKQTFSGPLRVKLYLSSDDEIDENSDTLSAAHTEQLELDRDASVRLTIPGKPAVIPAGTPRRRYFLGIVLDVEDANDANDRTMGFDTAEIRVLHQGEFPMDDLLSGARTSEIIPGRP